MTMLKVQDAATADNGTTVVPDGVIVSGAQLGFVFDVMRAYTLNTEAGYEARLQQRDAEIAKLREELEQIQSEARAQNSAELLDELNEGLDEAARRGDPDLRIVKDEGEIVE